MSLILIYTGATCVLLAQEIKCADSLMSISLGQGQGPIAQRLIEKATRKGMYKPTPRIHDMTHDI